MDLSKLDVDTLKSLLGSWRFWLTMAGGLGCAAVVWIWVPRLRPIVAIIGGIALWGLFLLPARAVVTIVMPDMEDRWPASLLLIVTAILAVVAVIRVAYPPEPLPECPPPKSPAETNK